MCPFFFAYIVCMSMFCTKVCNKTIFSFIIFRSLFLTCHSSKPITMEGEKKSQKSMKDQNELKKAANLLFGTLEPSYLWEYSAKHFENACSLTQIDHQKCQNVESNIEYIQRVGSGNPTLVELCSLVSFLLDVVSLVNKSNTFSIKIIQGKYKSYYCKINIRLFIIIMLQIILM